MKLRCFALSFLCAMATAASPADPQLLKLLMPDAKVVSGIDADRVKVTPFGQFLLSQAPLDSGLNELAAATGFDPRRDIHDILMASPADAQKRSGLLVVRGSFDSARIAQVIQAAGKPVELYHGIGILGTTKNAAGVSHGAAFLDDSIAVMGDLDSVRGAIDRRNTGGGPSAELTDKILRTSANQDAWVVSTAPVSAFAQAMHDRNIRGALQGDLIKAIEQSSGGVRFGSVIEISGELTARTDQDASSLADVLKFFLNMAQMNAPAGQAAQFAGLLKNLTVNADANAVKLSVAIPELDLETLIRLSSGHSRAGAPKI
jgi:hypothetical protein